MKPVQYFSDEYLEKCKAMNPTQIAQFIEDFRKLHGNINSGKSRLISIKVPETLLEAFKAKAQLHNLKYQTQIKTLMLKWLSEGGQ